MEVAGYFLKQIVIKGNIYAEWLRSVPIKKSVLKETALAILLIC